MTTASKESANGFVLIDALLAVAMLSTAGTAAYLAGVAFLESQERQLDRSAVLATLRSISKEVVLTGQAVDQQPSNGFSYELIRRDPPSERSQLVTFVVEARSAPGSTSYSLPFLAHAGPS